MSKTSQQTQVEEIKEPTVDAQPKLSDVVNGDLENVQKTVAKPEVKVTSALAQAASDTSAPGQLTPKEETSGQLIIRSIIADYKKVMAPGRPVGESEGAVQQLRLWRAIEQVMRSPAELFHVNMNTLLEEIAKERKGVFSERYAFRFFHRIELPADGLKTFERLMNLFLTTCEPASRRQALKQVDMQKTLETVPSEDVRQRIFAFYNHK